MNGTYSVYANGLHDGKAMYEMADSGSTSGSGSWFIWWQDADIINPAITGKRWFASEWESGGVGSNYIMSTVDASATNPWDADWNVGSQTSITASEGDCP